MPRKGKGSKTQAIQTAKDQTYGSAKQQEMAQEVAPLPQNVAGMGEPTALPVANSPYANPDMQQTVLQMETFLPTRFDAS